MRKYQVLLVISIMFTGFLSSTANANLMTNSGFESGLSAWSCTGANYCVSTSEGGPIEGSYALMGFDNEGYATLSQEISTTAGSIYNFSFFSKAYQQEGNQLAYSFSGYNNAIFVSATTYWLQTIGNFVATDSTTLVEFYFATDPGTGIWWIDSVSVDPASTPVPEPVTMLLLALGFVGLVGVRRKAKK